MNPLPFAIAAAIAGVPLFGAAALALPLFTLLARIAQVALLAGATNAPLRARDFALVPLLDLVQFAGQFVPYANDRVTWRGYTARIGRNTELTELMAA